ncbi:hypothetical protein N0V86_000527 [Didymella sp. IMI 355093]|nr:hypothetical protein N0V86_000527 [Didymella sp. IMI 355093]
MHKTLRNKYMAFLLSNFAFKTDLKWLPRFVATFGKLLYVWEASLFIFYDPSIADSPVDLLPVLELQVRWPALYLRFESPAPSGLQLPFDVNLTADFNRLLDKYRYNATLAGRIKDSVLSSLEFHSRSYLHSKYPNSHLSSRIQIRFKREYKQLWMDGTHSFDQLQHFLTATGLMSLTTLDVWVGIASLGAMGKGLRTPSEIQELGWLMDRGTPIV